VTANGADDPLFVKWFGDGDYISVVGAFQSILSSNKANVTIRCDDIDGKCVLFNIFADPPFPDLNILPSIHIL
jgi:hypothetical protein